jgi:hypothetical protein
MKNLVTIILLATIAAIFISFLSGCSTFQKQQAKAEAFYSQYPNELAKVCADQFPVTERVIKGKDSIHRDTLKKYITVNCPPNGKDTVKLQVPITQTITNTIVRVDSIVKENTAKTQVFKDQNGVLGAQNEKLTKDLAAANKLAADRIFWIIRLSILLLALISWHIYRFFAV